MNANWSVLSFEFFYDVMKNCVPVTVATFVVAEFLGLGTLSICSILCGST